ncbi:hypothetical protein BF7_00140 [Pseudomonas phage Bf7]|uniref:Uncharacterized protein n=1 Tax=Pseudomonas phage Bf7 TaxID=1100790 RepID=H2ELW4_9CAUD|nr:hypothetical protein BF7_00140 [Pseudomonas phage Bf7]AEX65866.1 hypothetical protein BF7_00140 [Pseudomonas phage Bf7]
MSNPHSVTEMVFKGLSDNLQAAIDTGNEPWARVILGAAVDSTITKVHYAELRQDFETAFGDLEDE